MARQDPEQNLAVSRLYGGMENADPQVSQFFSINDMPSKGCDAVDPCGGQDQKVRTGLFRYVRHERIWDMMREGWMVVADLGATHGQWSVLMWRCDCPGAEGALGAPPV